MEVTRSLTVPDDVTALRLDAFLARYVPSCSRRTAQRAIAAGSVRVNGRRAPKGSSVRAGEIVEVPGDLYAPPPLQPNAELNVAVSYEDAAVIVIDKPPGMPSHALHGDETDTAANFLLARYPELRGVGKTDKEPGLVHRLDTETSGVLVVAHTAAAYVALRKQFAGHQVAKEYLALVHGNVAAAGEIRWPIAHDRHNRRKMRVCPPGTRTSGARPALTRYRPIEHFDTYTLLSVEIPTGVMHQIRVHLASVGHPIVGDRLYGGAVCEADPARHLLHAHGITVVHPVTRRPLHVESDLPPDFRGFVERLRGTPHGPMVAARKRR